MTEDVAITVLTDSLEARRHRQVAIERTRDRVRPACRPGIVIAVVPRPTACAFSESDGQAGSTGASSSQELTSAQLVAQGIAGARCACPSSCDA